MKISIYASQIKIIACFDIFFASCFFFFNSSFSFICLKNIGINWKTINPLIFQICRRYETVKFKLNLLLCWLNIHRYKVIGISFSFGVSGSVKTIQCKICGIKKTSKI